MKKRKRPLLAGMPGSLLMGVTLLVFPLATIAQTPPATEKPSAEKQSDEDAERQKELAEKRAEQLKLARERRLKANQPARNTRVTQTPSAKPNDVPEPTVELKPGEMPGIKFDMLTYDFGRIRAGGDVIHDFWFTNTGNGPLEILRVKPG